MVDKVEDTVKSDQKLGGGREPRAREPQLSVRESLKEAVKVEAEKEERLSRGEGEPEPKSRKTESEDDGSEEVTIKDLKLASDKDSETEDDKEVAPIKAAKESEEEVSEAPDKTEAPKEKVPAGLPKDVSENWAKLPPSVKQYVAKSQKDLSDTKADLGRRVAQYRDMDQVLSHYESSIRQLGVTPAQTVDRLFQWMNALAGPQKNQAILQLAKDFGIQLDQQPDIYSQQDATQPQVAQIPPELIQEIQQLKGEVTQFKTLQERQRETAAKNTVNSWAGLQPDGTYKNKPHLEQVRSLMFATIQADPSLIIGDSVNLDEAYERACRAHPEVNALITEERETARIAAAKAKREADVAKAKKASISIKPGSPVLGTDEPRSLNSKKPLSVRDSILGAVKEHRT